MSNANDIRPFYIIPGVNVDLKDDATFEGLACVDMKVEKKSAPKYTITTNVVNIYSTYEKSWLAKQNVSFDTVYSGVILHEISHIKYEAFSVQQKIQNGFFHSIYNTLLDNQGEYHLTSDFPGVSKYIRTILLMLKRTTVIDHESKAARKAEIQFQQLFYLARFGVILPGADIDFINFCWPLVLSATRGDVKNVVDASTAIYIYIISNVDPSTLSKIMSSSSHAENPMTEGDIADAALGKKILSNSAENTIAQIASGEFSQDKGKGGEVSIADEDNAFYRQVLGERQELIENIRKAFKIVLSKHATAPSYEGDLNYKRMISAYINSLTGDESLDYTYNKKINHLLDLVVLRDISYSTKDMSVTYATLNVALLAALSLLKGIRIAEIDFSNTPRLNLSFDEKLSGAKLEPNYEGGTEIIPAYELLKTFTWRAERRICVVITDGEIEDYGDYTKLEKELSASCHIEFVKFLISKSRSKALDARQDKLIVIENLEEFPNSVAKWLMGRL